MFRKAQKEACLPSMEENKISMSEPEYKMPVHLLPDEG